MFFPTPEPEEGKILSFLLCALQPRDLSSMNTQRKTFYTNGNSRQNLELELGDPGSTHNGQGWDEFTITRGVASEVPGEAGRIRGLETSKCTTDLQEGVSECFWKLPSWGPDTGS